MTSRILSNPRRFRRRRRIAMVAGTLALSATAATAALSIAAYAPQADQRIDMKVLLLSNTAADATTNAWEDNLKRAGTPYVRINADTAPALTAATFAAGEQAKYQAVIVSGANGTQASGRSDGFSDAEWAPLRAFEKKFGIRQLDVNAVPGPPLGLNWASSTGTLDGQSGTLTAAGRQQFSALKGSVPFQDLDPAVSETFGALATPCDGVAVPTCNTTSFETVLAGAGGTSLVGIARTKDGREEMVSTFSGNQYQLHNALLRESMLSWVTGGVYIGMDRSYLAIDVDDLFVPDLKWDPTINGTPGDGRTPATPASPEVGLRMTAGDVTRLVSFQNANDVKLNMLFNGSGVGDYRNANGGTDPMFDAFMANKGAFNWISHTWTHASLGSPNPENPSEATIRAEISQNNTFAAQNALPGYNRTELVTGEHSGIGTGNPVVAPEPTMPGALNAEGVTTVGADNSREVGQRRVGSAYTLPRYPTNMYYNVATWEDQLDEYDWLYLDKTAAPLGRGNCTSSATMTCFQSPVTKEQFIARESTAIVQRMLGNDPRPSYVHQSNVISDPANASAANRGDGILQAVLGKALADYRSYFSKPFVQPSMTALREELRRQTAWKAAAAANRASGYIRDGKVTITAATAVDVPITGTTVGDLYAGQRSGWRSFAAGQIVTLDPDDPRNTASPAISGTANPGNTLTVSDGTWNGTPTIAYTRQWQRRATATAPWVNIAGATGATYTVVAGDVGQSLRAVISAGNRVSSWSMAITAPVTATSPPPPPPPAPVPPPPPPTSTPPPPPPPTSTPPPPPPTSTTPTSTTPTSTTPTSTTPTSTTPTSTTPTSTTAPTNTSTTNTSTTTEATTAFGAGETADAATPLAGASALRTQRAVRPAAFTCRVTRARSLVVSCAVRNRAGGLLRARIRAVRGDRVIARASGRVLRGKLPALRLRRTVKRYDTRITITVRLANGKLRGMTRTLKL